MSGRGAVVYVGTYTEQVSHLKGTPGEGISVYRFDPSSGALQFVQVVAGPVNPSFVALDPGGRYLYAVNETGELDGERSGAVSAFAVDRETGRLTALNRVRTGSPGPCHVSVDATASLVLVAHYGGGSISALPIEEGGRLGGARALFDHAKLPGVPAGSTPRAHAILPDPENRFAVATDLGLDMIVTYRLYPVRRTVELHGEPVRLAAGAGPRHLCFHPGGRYLFVINETSSTITTLAWEARGALRELQTLSTVPEGFTGTNSCADLHVAPSGRFVYGSNRGHDSIAIFLFDEVGGELEALGHESTHGATPRNFALSPTGEFLLVANQDSDTVVTFRVESDTGALTATGRVDRVPAPVCVKFLE